MAEETKNPDHDKMKAAIPAETTSAPTAEALPASDMPTVPSSPEQQGEIIPEATPGQGLVPPQRRCHHTRRDGR